MIKTIDTRNITDIMLEAQNVIDGITTYSDPLSFKDAADIFIAMTEAAPAVEPAQRCNCCGYLVTDSEHKGCLRAAKQEPAQVVKTFWASENILKESLRDNISCILTTTKCAANTVPLYTAPPAIEDETRKMVLELCKVVDNYTDIPLTKQIREKLEAGK